MKQPLSQINLYNRALLPKAPVFSMRWVVGLVLLGLLLQLALGVYWHQEQRLLQQQRQAADLALQRASQALAQLNAANGERRPDPRLAQSVANLERRLAQRTQAWQWLSVEIQSSRPRYADWLQALSMARLEGVWLNHLHFESGWMTLEGRTLDPARLPDWLRQLQQQPALSGLSFSSFQLGSERVSAELRSPSSAAAKMSLEGSSFRLQGTGGVAPSPGVGGGP